MSSPGSRRVVVGIALSLCLSLWFIASIRWDELGAAMASVKAGPVALACGLLVMEFVLRAARWKVLLRPAAPLARVRELFAATVIGAAANTLLPARAGEIAKPLVAARRAGVNIPTAIATAVMERVYDIFGLLTVLLTMAILLPDQVADTREEAVLVVNLKRYGALFGAAGLGAMAVFFALAMRGGAARALFVRIASLGPGPLRDRVMSLYDGFVAGLGNARDPSGQLQAAGLSLLIWQNGAVAIYVLFWAFGLDLPYSAACFTAVAIALTVALPQAPGFFGVFHVAIEKTLVLWEVDPTPAKAFAIVFWGVSFLPVTTIGLGALWREGLTLGELWSKKGQEAPPEPVAAPRLTE